MFSSHYLFLHMLETFLYCFAYKTQNIYIYMQIGQSFRVLNFILCHFMWHMSHFHKSNCISNTFMQSTPNIACCFSKEVLWNLLQKRAQFTIQIRPEFGFVLVSSFFIHSHKKVVSGQLLAGHCVGPCQPSHLPRWDGYPNVIFEHF